MSELTVTGTISKFLEVQKGTSEKGEWQKQGFLIKTEDDYRASLIRLDEIFDAPTGTPESDEADILGLMIDDYENKHYPIGRVNWWMEAH